MTAPPVLRSDFTNQGTTGSPSVAFTSLTADPGDHIVVVISTDGGIDPAIADGYEFVAGTGHLGHPLRVNVQQKDAEGGETAFATTIPGFTSGSWIACALVWEHASVQPGESTDDPLFSAHITSGTAPGRTVLCCTSGYTGGFKSGAFMVNDARLTDVSGAFIGYHGLQVGYHETIKGGFVEGWGMDGLDQVTGLLANVMVGIGMDAQPRWPLRQRRRHR